MALSVVCSKCRSAYSLPDNMAGKSIKCKKCAQAIAVKAPSKPSVNRPLPAKTSPAAKSAPPVVQSSRKSKSGILIVAVLVLGFGALTVSAVGSLAGYYYYTSRDSQETKVAGAEAPPPVEPPAPPTKAPLPPPTLAAAPTKPAPVAPLPKPPEAKPPEKPKEPEKPKDPPKPEAVNPLTKLLTNLKDAGDRGDGGAVLRDLNVLATMQRDDKRADEVTKLIVQWLNPEWGDGIVATQKALRVWATPASIDPLGKLLERQDKNGSPATMELLAKTKEPAAAELIAARLARPDEQQVAAKSLEAMGGAAEAGWLAMGASENEFARTEARKMLKELKTADAAIVERTGKDVKSSVPERRAWAAQWLTEVPVDAKLKPAALKAIESLFLDTNVKVREESGKAAARWATTKEDLPTLIVALDNPSPVARTAILEVLAKHNDERSANAVALCLPTERALAAPILKAIGKPAERAVAAFVHHPDGGVREEVTKLLTEYKTDDTILTPRAVMDLSSADGTTRGLAIQRLGKSKPIEAHRPAVLEAVKALVKSPDGNARNQGVQLLASWGTKEEVPFFLEMMEADATRPTAMEALGVLKDARGAEAVAKRLAVANERPQAVKSLQTMGPAAEEVVVAYLKDADDAVAIEACKVLGAVGTKKSLTPLRGLAASKNKQVIQVAGEAWKAITARGK